MEQFDPRRHPRNRLGQFRELLGQLLHGESVRFPDGTTVTRQPPGPLRRGSLGNNAPWTIRRTDGYSVGAVDAGNAARRALDSSAESTHPDSLGGKSSYQSFAEFDAHQGAVKAAAPAIPRPRRESGAASPGRPPQFGVTQRLEGLTPDQQHAKLTQELESRGPGQGIVLADGTTAVRTASGGYEVFEVHPDGSRLASVRADIDRAVTGNKRSYRDQEARLEEMTETASTPEEAATKTLAVSARKDHPVSAGGTTSYRSFEHYRSAVGAGASSPGRRSLGKDALVDTPAGRARVIKVRGDVVDVSAGGGLGGAGGRKVTVPRSETTVVRSGKEQRGVEAKIRADMEASGIEYSLTNPAVAPSTVARRDSHIASLSDADRQKLAARDDLSFGAREHLRKTYGLKRPAAPAKPKPRTYATPYVPKGRTDESSYDYTDDPRQLAMAFGSDDLQGAIADEEAQNPGSPTVLLKFDYEESVPRQAVDEALAIQRDRGASSPGRAPAVLEHSGQSWNLTRAQAKKIGEADPDGKKAIRKFLSSRRAERKKVIDELKGKAGSDPAEVQQLAQKQQSLESTIAEAEERAKTGVISRDGQQIKVGDRVLIGGDAMDAGDGSGRGDLVRALTGDGSIVYFRKPPWTYAMQTGQEPDNREFKARSETAKWSAYKFRGPLLRDQLQNEREGLIFYEDNYPDDQGHAEESRGTVSQLEREMEFLTPDDWPNGDPTAGAASPGRGRIEGQDGSVISWFRNDRLSAAGQSGDRETWSVLIKRGDLANTEHVGSAEEAQTRARAVARGASSPGRSLERLSTEELLALFRNPNAPPDVRARAQAIYQKRTTGALFPDGSPSRQRDWDAQPGGPDSFG